MIKLTRCIKSRTGGWLGLCLAAGLAWSFIHAGSVAAQNQNQKKPNNNNQKKPAPNKPVANKPVAPPPPKSALLTVEDWQKAPLKALEPGEIDRLIAKELQQDKIEPAQPTTDEQFIRR